MKEEEEMTMIQVQGAFLINKIHYQEEKKNQL